MDSSFGSAVTCCVTCCVTLAVCLTSLSPRYLPCKGRDLDRLGSMSWEFFPHCSPGWRAVTRPWMEATRRMHWWTSRVGFPSPLT